MLQEAIDMISSYIAEEMIGAIGSQEEMIGAIGSQEEIIGAIGSQEEIIVDDDLQEFD